MINLGRRFFVLTAFGYLVALFSCAAIVWTLATPFLSAAKQERLEEIVQQQANATALSLDEVFDRVEYLARSPAVVDFMYGTSSGLTDVSDQVSAFSTEAVRQVVLLDFAGETLFAFQPLSHEGQLFLDVEFREGFADLQRSLLQPDRPGRISLRRTHDDSATHLLLSVPILIDGSFEGAVVMEIVLDLGKIEESGSRLITSFQRSFLPSTVVTAPVPEMPLHVQLSDTISTEAGETSETFELVSQISFGLAAVLIVPFLAMSTFGARHLVAPTLALERSRARLASQQVELKLKSEELHELAVVAELSRDAILVTDRRGDIIWVNAAFSEMTGYAQDEVKGQNTHKLLHGRESDHDTVEALRDAYRKGAPLRVELLNYAKGGRAFWAGVSISPITDDKGQVHRFAVISSDISERRAAEAALAEAHRETQYRATHDTLSGLPNRRYLDDVLENDVTEHAAPRTLIRVDLDFFKNVNDTHGHAAGDHVLQVVSNILQSHSRKGDLVARVGGDEFVVLLKSGATTSEANLLCERYRAEICKDIMFSGKTCRVGASFGVASALDGLIGNDELLVGADAALYLSKYKGRNTTTLYTPEVHADVQSKRRSASEIEQAIENKEFEPYFQPQIDAQTRTFAGAEALVRWHHPQQGILAPNAFLPIAEQLSLITQIDEIVYSKALQSILKLKGRGFEVPKISFNLVPNQLENPFLQNIPKYYDLGCTRVAFEVLESVLVEEQDAAFGFQIDMLRDLGFGIEVDDFGSGHASIVGLMQLRPDAMKLDQRLVMPLGNDTKAEVTVGALVEIGRSQGIKITAEGVETEDQARILTSLGVDTLQGYNFAPPLPLDKLEAFLLELGEDRTIVA